MSNLAAPGWPSGGRRSTILSTMHPATLRQLHLPSVLSHLAAADPDLAVVIGQSDPFALVPRDRRPPYQELMKAIVYQQLSGQAAGTILNRVLALYGQRGRFPSPEAILATPEDRFRTAGLSRAKTAALLDLAAKTVTGVVPRLGEARRMADEDLITRLVQVRGVGRWTAEMFLMFGLGRPDRLPADDLGVRRGFMKMLGMRRMPSPERIRRHGRRWAPYRTVASWYCWRAADW